MTNTITVVDSGSTSTSGQGGQSLITGTPTPGSFIDAPLLAPGGSVGGFSIEVSGTWTGTLAFEQSQDGGVTYTAMDAVINGINTKVQSITSNGVFKGNCASDNHIRMRATAAMTGTANINIIATPPVDVSHVIIVGGGGAGDVVQVSNLPTTVDTNSGNAGASTLRSVLDGTGATGVTQLTGGVGSIGWLSGIFSKLSSLVTGVVLAAGTAIIGKVGIDQTTPGTTNGVVVNVANYAGATGTTAPTSAVELGAVYNTSPPAPSNGQLVQLQSDSQGDLKQYLASLMAGEDLTPTSVRGSILGIQNVSIAPIVASNYTASQFTNSYLTTSVTKNFAKASAGQLLAIQASNSNAALRYLCFFNKASSPTAGTDVPVYSFPIPAGTAAAPGMLILDVTFFANMGDYFSTGIAWAISTSLNFAADSATATDHVLNGRYV